MTPRNTEINEKTVFKFGITQVWVIVTGIIGYTIVGVVGWFSLVSKIEDTATANIKPLRQNILLIQTELSFQGQYIWSIPENAYLRSLKNEAIQQHFREFASEEKGSIVYREPETGLFKFKN